MKSRKTAGFSTTTMTTTTTIHPQTNSKSFTGSTTAAAVSVTRFGQATFTSVRRQDHENGNYVPLKKSKLDSDDFQNQEQTLVNKPIESKPKVYKFFKSRASSETKPSVINDRVNRSPPRPLVLNNFSKQDGIKRITTSTSQVTYGKIKTNDQRNNSQQSTTHLISKSVNLNDNKSCEIKICGDKTIKKIISPNKITEFHIRNNSNIRNATIKPVSTTSVQILPANRGIRSSRRLKGIEPESISTETSKTSSTIHLVFEKKTSTYQNKNKKLTTTISIANDENEEGKSNSSLDDVHHLTKTFGDGDEVKLENKIENNQIKNEDEIFDGNVNGNNNSTDFESTIKLANLIESVEKVENQQKNTDNNHVKESSNLIDSNENIVEQLDKTEQRSVILEQTEESNSQTSTMDTIEKFTDFNSQSSTANGQQQNDNENKLDQISNNNKSEQSGDNKNKVESKTCGGVVKPKKKIFSHRDRNKIEFNTKSFFSSDLKDEFDEMELEKNPSQSNFEKKTLESDEDETYIKLKRIKKAHQCHELGETEQFDEDIKYYLSGIVSSNPNSMRCLSILGLTQQTMRPEFRMHLRAHDDMSRIIKALMDAPQDSNLALCTACLMFIYNQDRLTMDIDPNALSLMLELLETRSDECNQVEEKHRSKVRSLVEEMKNKGHAQYLKLSEITAGKLAMETLLGLTSKRAGDWFKVELRKMKGIDFIVNTVIRCAEDHAEEGQMVKIDRCMHVLENVTFNNVENQLYITNYNESKFLSTCISLLIECKHQIISSNDSKIFLSAFFSILRVFTNLTSESVQGCKIVGTFDGVIELLLESLFELPSFIMSDQRFDLMVIILCLCINLAEFCEHIRDIIMNSTKYMSKLCELLFKKIEEAAQVEQQTDHLLESHETVQMTEAMQDNLLMQMISKSGTHMEHSLLSACVCLLFGCCIQDSERYKELLKNTLPDNSFKPLVEQLEKLRDFAHLADIMTQKGKDRVQKVLQIFKTYNGKS